jgi:hypothetical protein
VGMMWGGIRISTVRECIIFGFIGRAAGSVGFEAAFLIERAKLSALRFRQ